MSNEIDWRKPIRFKEFPELSVRVVAGPFVDGNYAVEWQQEPDGRQISSIIRANGFLACFPPLLVENVPEPMVRVKMYSATDKPEIYRSAGGHYIKIYSDRVRQNDIEFTATIPKSVAIAAGLEYAVI